MADDTDKAPEKKDEDAGVTLKRKAEDPAEGDADAAGERRAAAPAAGFSGFAAAKTGFAAFASGGTTSGFGDAKAAGSGFGSAGGFGSASGGILTGGGFGSVGAGFGSTCGGFGNSLFPAFGASGSTAKVFGGASAAGAVKEGAEDEDDNNGSNSPPPLEPSYVPVVTLSEQEKVTGEEDEVPVCQVAGTLFAFESPDGVKPSAWKERGRGDLHVNLNKAGNAARMVMRAKGHLRLILNAKIFPEMSVKEMDGGKGVTFACVNVADSVEVSATALRTFALRLGGKDAAEKAAFILGNLKETLNKIAEAEKAGTGSGSGSGDKEAAASGVASDRPKGEEAV